MQRALVLTATVRHGLVRPRDGPGAILCVCFVGVLCCLVVMCLFLCVSVVDDSFCGLFILMGLEPSSLSTMPRPAAASLPLAAASKNLGPGVVGMLSYCLCGFPVRLHALPEFHRNFT